RRHTRAPRGGDISCDIDALRPRLALIEHECLEPLGAEGARRAEHGDLEILIERDATGFEVADRLLVPVLKVAGVEAEMFGGTIALLAVPPIAAEHTADVEEHELDALTHPTSTARAGAPS